MYAGVVITSTQFLLVIALDLPRPKAEETELTLVQLGARRVDTDPTQTFISKQCRDGINQQRMMFKSSWQSMAASHPWHDVYDKVLSHDGLNLAYVYNQKVGTVSMESAFGTFNETRVQYSGVGGTVEYGAGVYSKEAFDLLKDKFLFTVVRDPLACAWSAYDEVSHRGIDESVLNMPCNRGDDRYLEYLKLLKRGKLFHSEVFHSWPQTVKVDVLSALNRDSFDFIVRLENFETDMRRLFARMRPPPNEATIKEFIDGFNNMDKEHLRWTDCDADMEQASHNEHGLNAQTCKVACELYDLDFVCFGYPRPDCCSSGVA